MVKPCCAQVCPKAKDEKVSIFGVPKNQVKFELWAEKLITKKGRLRSTDYVCEKHFEESQIIKCWEKYTNDGDLLQVVSKTKLKKMRIRKQQKKLINS